jgi:hypothetical protein
METDESLPTYSDFGGVLRSPSPTYESDNSLESYVSSSGPEDTTHGRPPPPKLLHAIEALVLPTSRAQRTRTLPFQLRVLRRGFIERHKDIMTSDDIPDQREVHVVYRIVDCAMPEIYTARMSVQLGWCCPLCDLMGLMPTRQALSTHIEYGHPEVQVTWEQAASPSTQVK